MRIVLESDSRIVYEQRSEFVPEVSSQNEQARYENEVRRKINVKPFRRGIGKPLRGIRHDIGGNQRDEKHYKADRVPGLAHAGSRSQASNQSEDL